MSKRRPPGLSLGQTMLVGLLLTPAVCALTFCGLVFVTQAALGTDIPSLDLAAIQQIALDIGLLPSSTPTVTNTPTLTPTASQTATGTPSPTPTGTHTATHTPTTTATLTHTATLTITPTHTATPTPSATASHTPTASPTLTPTLPPTPTQTRTPTISPTRTTTPTITPSPTQSPTPGPPTDTEPPTIAPSWSPTPSETAVGPTATYTPTPTHTRLPPTATTPPACNPTGNTAFEATLLSLINQERQNRGLAPYNLDSRLQAAARLHSADMACNNFLSHTGSDGSSVRDRVRRQGYNWTWVGENIYATSNTSSTAPQQAFTWWMNSGPHQANLLNTNYIDIGIGYMYRAGSTYGGYFTAVFARP